MMKQQNDKAGFRYLGVCSETRARRRRSRRRRLFSSTAQIERAVRSGRMDEVETFPLPVSVGFYSPEFFVFCNSTFK